MSEATDVTPVTCGCCGEPRQADEVARLNCHPELAVCGNCVDWLASTIRARPKITPIFPVREMGEAREFWVRTGVEIELYDAGYAFALVDGAEIAHLAHHPGLDPETNAASCYIHVGDPEVWHERWTAAGLPVTELETKPWGMREFSVTDPSGNLLRVGTNS